MRVPCLPYRELRSKTGRDTEKERVLLVHVKNKTKQDSICIMAYLSMKNRDHLIEKVEGKHGREHANVKRSDQRLNR